MRALKFLNLGILAAVVASSAVLYAQDEKQQEDKPKQEEPKRQDQAKPESKQPESKQDEMKSPRQDEARPAHQGQEQQQQQQQQRPEEKQQPGDAMKPGRQEPARQEPARQEPGRPEAGQQQDRARGNNGRIPDDRFRAQFGREHHFPMQRPEVVEGRPRFQYGGYSFVLVDAWPPQWAYTDDCYIDNVDGEYFLFDLRHPEVRLALMVVM
jgi:hypothetical protein